MLKFQFDRACLQEGEGSANASVGNNLTLCVFNSNHRKRFILEL